MVERRRTQSWDGSWERSGVAPQTRQTGDSAKADSSRSRRHLHSARRTTWSGSLDPGHGLRSHPPSSNGLWGGRLSLRRPGNVGDTTARRSNVTPRSPQRPGLADNPAIPARALVPRRPSPAAQDGTLPISPASLAFFAAASKSASTSLASHRYGRPGVVRPVAVRRESARAMSRARPSMTAAGRALWPADVAQPQLARNWPRHAPLARR